MNTVLDLVSFNDTPHITDTLGRSAVALDNSDYAFKALRKAVDMAKKENAELIIYSAYSVLSDVEGFSMEPREALGQHAEEIVARGKAIAEKADVLVRPGHAL